MVDLRAGTRHMAKATTLQRKMGANILSPGVSESQCRRMSCFSCVQ